MGRLITILGGGPSGLCTSINLAKAGYTVEVHEKNETVGSRFGNCFQILENYTEKEELLESLKKMNIKINFFCHPSKDIDFYDSKLNCCSVSSTKPYGYYIKRGNEKATLDYGLAEQARESGVKIIYKSKLPLEKADIIATGAKSATGVAKEIIFDTDIADTFKVILDDNIAPKGFSYLFVINKKGTLGTAILRKFSEIDKFADRTADRFQKIVNFKLQNQRDFISIVDFCLAKSAVVNNALYVGEAAGFQDSLFGIGIRISLTSGYLAARSIIDNVDYDSLWKKHFFNKMKASVVNRFFYELGGNFGYDLFNKRAKNRDLGEFGYKLSNPTKLKNIFFPIIKIIWKKKSGCRHKVNCLWCR